MDSELLEVRGSGHGQHSLERQGENHEVLWEIIFRTIDQFKVNFSRIRLVTAELINHYKANLNSTS
jgi:hypothetical protein